MARAGGWHSNTKAIVSRPAHPMSIVVGVGTDLSSKVDLSNGWGYWLDRTMGWPVCAYIKSLYSFNSVLHWGWKSSNRVANWNCSSSLKRCLSVNRREDMHLYITRSQGLSSLHHFLDIEQKMEQIRSVISARAIIVLCSVVRKSIWHVFYYCSFF